MCDLLLTVAYPPGRMDQQRLLSLPKDTEKVDVTKGGIEPLCNRSTVGCSNYETIAPHIIMYGNATNVVLDTNVENSVSATRTNKSVLHNVKNYSRCGVPKQKLSYFGHIMRTKYSKAVQSGWVQIFI